MEIANLFKRLMAVLLTLSFVGCSSERFDSGTAAVPGGINVVDADAISALLTLPHVANVTRHGPEGKPSHRIIHICNWHLVSLDDYLADLQSQTDEPLTKDEMDRYQSQLVDEVSELQVQQVQLLTERIKKHGLKQVHLDGFCIGHDASFKRIIGEWTETERRLAELKADVADFGDDERAKPIAASVKQLEDELNLEKEHYGAAAQLWYDGILEKVLPCEDETLLDAAKPIADDGTYREDADAIEAREDFIVRSLLESGQVSYVILGGSHDLAVNVERLSGGKAEYLRVELEAWREFAERRIVAVDVSEGSCPNVGVKRAEVRNRRPHAKRRSLSPQRISPTSHHAVWVLISARRYK